ncbi:MAG: LacI family transcriptional regulator [Chloroflexi bacterium]|nr:LacI family transcriptional regulator [Chloroflexota bacterium]
MRLAAELGYTPNAIAQSLQQRHSDTIGLVVPDVADPFWGEVVKGIEHVLGDTNKALFLSASHHDATRQLKVIELFHRRRVDGIIIADAQLRTDQLARLTQLGAPVVFLNQQRDLQSEQVRSISIDNRLGGRLAA